MGRVWPKNGAAWETMVFGFSAIEARELFRRAADDAWDAGSLFVPEGLRNCPKESMVRRNYYPLRDRIWHVSNPRIQGYYRLLAKPTLRSTLGDPPLQPLVYELLKRLELICPEVELIFTLGTVLDNDFGIDCIFRLRNSRRRYCCVDVTINRDKIGRHTKKRLIVSPHDFATPETVNMLACEIKRRIQCRTP